MLVSWPAANGRNEEILCGLRLFEKLNVQRITALILDREAGAKARKDLLPRWKSRPWTNSCGTLASCLGYEALARLP